MKRFSAILTLFLPALFVGCSFNAGIETLLSPPKLSAQQELIYNALKEYAGTNISLKYPKSGKNLSAFIVDDIDGDAEEEAIVFYQKNASKPEDIFPRMNILDSVDSKWRSVYDHEADGNEIEQVEISKLGSSDKINIIVGYSLLNRNEKSFSIYEYSDGKLSTGLENEPYSVFDTVDLNGDGINELFTASAKTASKEASADVYYLDGNNEYHHSSAGLDESYTSYRNITYSKPIDNETAVFLDAETGNGSIVTEVLKIDSRNNLIKDFSPDIEKGETMRSAAYLSSDIDNDGKIEIPVPYFCSGYDENSEEPVYFTSWYEINSGILKHKYESWFSITDGYVFIIPEEWYGHVTAKTNLSENEITLYGLNYNETEEEIFTVKVVLGNKSTKIPEDDSFQLLRSRGGRQFFIKINENSSYVKQPEEIIMKFKFEE